MGGNKNEKSNEALAGFEPAISCLLDRRFNQLSHKAVGLEMVVVIAH